MTQFQRLIEKWAESAKAQGDYFRRSDGLIRGSQDQHLAQVINNLLDDE